jgi:hypothetical protein
MYAVAFEFQFFAIGTTLFIAAHFMLIALAARRFRMRKQEPPETFPLIGLGLIAGALGALINAGIAWNVVAPSLDLLGKRIMTEGMVLLLVLGVGGFLGPRLLGFAALPKFMPQETMDRDQTNSLFYKVAGLAVLLSLIAEYGFGLGAMAFLRAAVVTAVIVSTNRPWKVPAMRTTLAWCVWTANWFVILSLWLAALVPKYRIDLLHILFIGGFTLLILAVGTRVTLSHGGHNLALERRSWPLRIGLTSGLIAILARVGAPFAPFSYFAHLAYAALLWIGGVLLWGMYLFRWTSSQPTRSGR